MRSVLLLITLVELAPPLAPKVPSSLVVSVDWLIVSVISHVSNVRSSIQILNERMALLAKYLEDVHSGAVHLILHLALAITA